jgi:hypothetical protein
MALNQWHTMNAKARYLKRLQLQGALTPLTRVLEVLFRNVEERIPPDRRTALTTGMGCSPYV